LVTAIDIYTGFITFFIFCKLIVVHQHLQRNHYPIPPYVGKHLLTIQAKLVSTD
jgi:hypothetical protein